MSSPQSLVGRQSIYDRDLGIHAYELLFRPAPGGAGAPSGESATAEVILSAFADIGIDRVIDGRLAFINVDRDFIVRGGSLPLPPGKVVIEVLEHVEIDAEVIEALGQFRAHGYHIALDDFVYDESWRPALELAHIVKLDVMALGPAALRDHVSRLAGYDVRLLAEKVETREEYEACRELGFELFQGYFLSRPQVLTGERLATSQLSTLRLLGRMQDSDVEVEEIERLVGTDLPLSYQLMRYINSAFFGLPRRVESVRQAVVYMGLGALKRWVTLIALARSESQEGNLVHLALVRARMSERLAETAGHDEPNAFFTAGLFSTLDALLRRPLATILEDLPLAPALAEALLERHGPIGEVLACSLAYEACEWPEVAYGNLDSGTVGRIYLESVAWAHDVAGGLTTG